MPKSEIEQLPNDPLKIIFYMQEKPAYSLSLTCRRFQLIAKIKSFSAIYFLQISG